jgi:hypothetical protein
MGNIYVHLSHPQSPQPPTHHLKSPKLTGSQFNKLGGSMPLALASPFVWVYTFCV